MLQSSLNCCLKMYLFYIFRTLRHRGDLKFPQIIQEINQQINNQLLQVINPIAILHSFHWWDGAIWFTEHLVLYFSNFSICLILLVLSHIICHSSFRMCLSRYVEHFLSGDWQCLLISLSYLCNEERFLYQCTNV